ncbi:MAG: lipoprotein [Alphaproteobacteria bacterium]
MTRRELILGLLLASAATGIVGCGKKGPLNRPDGSSSMKVDRKTLKKKGQL